MMEALLGFMIITWSATFIYSAWQKDPFPLPASPSRQ